MTTRYGDTQGTLTGAARAGKQLLVGIGALGLSPFAVVVGGVDRLGDATRGGNDTLVSAEGPTDVLWGDALLSESAVTARGGADWFRFGRASGTDVTGDFEVGKDRSLLDENAPILGMQTGVFDDVPHFGTIYGTAIFLPTSVIYIVCIGGILRDFAPGDIVGPIAS